MWKSLAGFVYICDFAGTRRLSVLPASVVCISSPLFFFSLLLFRMLKPINLYHKFKQLNTFRIRFTVNFNSLKMSPRACLKVDDSVISSGFLDSFDNVMTDCDGVLWMANEAIPGSVETINALKKMGKHIIYITNNSTKCREEYLKKCAGLGFPATLEDIISTSYCAAGYLKNKGFQKKVYVFGTTGITRELEKVNIRYLPIGPDPVPDQWMPWIDELKLDPEVGAVIIGFDQHVSYAKLTKSASYLKNPDTHFIATNMDEQNPTDGILTIPAYRIVVEGAFPEFNYKLTPCLANKNSAENMSEVIHLALHKRVSQLSYIGSWLLVQL